MLYSPESSGETDVDAAAAAGEAEDSELYQPDNGKTCCSDASEEPGLNVWRHDEDASC